jgi:hypothetical protein
VDDGGFWDAIAKLDWRREDDEDAIVEPLVRALALLPDAEIGSFQEILARRLYDLDGRAWARESGDRIWLGEPDQVAVDSFLYARCAVVARGQDTYNAVRADPTMMPRNAEFESLLYVASTAYERKTGLEWDDLEDTEVSYETFSNEGGWPRTG